MEEKAEEKIDEKYLKEVEEKIKLAEAEGKVTSKVICPCDSNPNLKQVSDIAHAPYREIILRTNGCKWSVHKMECASIEEWLAIANIVEQMIRSGALKVGFEIKREAMC